MMKSSLWKPLIAVVHLLLAASIATAAVPQDQLDKVKNAAPDKSPVKVEKARKILVYTKCGAGGFAHSSIPLGFQAFKILGEKTGAFTVVEGTDPSVFKADNLAQFDAIVLMSTTGKLIESDDLKKSLLDFVKSGKGIVGIHAATDCSYDWADYGEMMGGYFDGHPWTSGVTVDVKIDDPKNPVNAAFAAKGFKIKDEIYQLRDPYSRKKLHVLLSLDISQPGMKRDGMKRTDGDYAVSYVRPYGKGRVFYCSLGHNEEVFWNPAVLQHYLAGTLYATGDLKIDDAPGVPAAAPAAAPADAIDKIGAYDFDKSRADLLAAEKLIQDQLANAPQLAKIEQRLLAILQDPATSLAARQFICQQLSIMGSAQSVPVLAKMLADDKLSDLALLALERIPDKSAGKALRDAMPAAKGNTLLGIINTLGNRRDDDATRALSKLAAGKDAPVASAAVIALGKIASKNALSALEDLSNKTDPAVLQARIVCADGLLASGDKSRAAKAFTALYEMKDAPAYIKGAAALGMARANPDKAMSIATSLLNTTDSDLQGAGITCIRQMTAPNVSQALAAEFPKLSETAQVMVITALADRGEAQALPVLLAATASQSTTVQAAAFKALSSSMANEQVILLLAQTAADDKSPAKDAARKSLSQVRGQEADTIILARIADPKTAAPIKRALLTAVGQRKPNNATPVLLAAAVDGTDEAVHGAAYSALRVIATAQDYPSIIKLLLAAKTDRDRDAAASITLLMAKKMDANAAKSPLSAALKDASVDQKAAILTILANLGGDDALALIRTSLADPDAKVQEAAIRGLANWPDPSATEDLLALAKKTDNKTYKVLTLRGLLRLLPLIQDNDARNKAALAILDIAAKLPKDAKPQALEAVNKVKDAVKDANVLKQADEIAKSLR